MLKPIHRVDCSPALTACQRMMQRFALWLCQAATSAADIDQPSLQPPTLETAIEANWLWDFLQRVDAGKPLLERAQTVAAMPGYDKAALRAWIQSVSALRDQFQAAPPPWPVSAPAIPGAAWQAFKDLMLAFYGKGLERGLPYLANGTPAAAGGVTYEYFVQVFRAQHRLHPNPNASEVCVLCGGELGDKPHVDHWVLESAFPLLSICADNLLLICNTCNEAPNKGKKPVHSDGSFVDWFHPYLRPGNGIVQLDYEVANRAVRCVANPVAERPRVDNLDRLLDLSGRWTKKFKAEYITRQDVLRRREQSRIEAGSPRHTRAEIQNYVVQFEQDLDPRAPHFEVQQALANALLDASRLDAWQTELGLVS